MIGIPPFYNNYYMINVNFQAFVNRLLTTSYLFFFKERQERSLLGSILHFYSDDFFVTEFFNFSSSIISWETCCVLHWSGSLM